MSLRVDFVKTLLYAVIVDQEKQALIYDTVRRICLEDANLCEGIKRLAAMILLAANVKQQFHR